MGASPGFVQGTGILLAGCIVGPRTENETRSGEWGVDDRSCDIENVPYG